MMLELEEPHVSFCKRGPSWAHRGPRCNLKDGPYLGINSEGVGLRHSSTCISSRRRAWPVTRAQTAGMTEGAGVGNETNCLHFL